MSRSRTGATDHAPVAMGVMTRLAYARAKEDGADAAALAKKAGLTPHQIDDRNAKLDVKSQVKFLDLVAEAVHDDLLGFHLAQDYDLRLIGLLYYTQSSCETMGEALRRCARYSSIVNEGFELRLREGGHVEIDFEYVGIARHSDRHQVEFGMVTLARICRQLTNRQVSAAKVDLIHRRSAGLDEFKSFFGSDVTFGAGEDRLAFAGTIKDLPVVSADFYLNEMLTRYCEQALAGRKPRQSPFGQSVENAIAVLLPHGKAGAGEIARKLGVSRRTLARRLSAEGLTFADGPSGPKRMTASADAADVAVASRSEISFRAVGHQGTSGAFTNACVGPALSAPHVPWHGLRLRCRPA
ncbi:MAG: AraC family transcriptional regulator ligand-binding domain-containing protein [Hyphomicrobiales bacterium]